MAKFLFAPLVIAIFISGCLDTAQDNAEKKAMNETSTVEPNAPPLNQAQELAVSKLSASDVEKIDTELLANTGSSWRKVAMVVGLTMSKTQGQFNDIPDLCYSQRVANLVEQGHLESQGNLLQMRYSEVRRSRTVQP
ncbi:DUF3658 domain-containing protein [Pseudomonas peli]|uniref:DUF3658 domain-containing protein n=1 Tax=Pseudomonas peli TaxID=592361 RepID=UPI003D319842